MARRLQGGAAVCRRIAAGFRLLPRRYGVGRGGGCRLRQGDQGHRGTGVEEHASPERRPDGGGHQDQLRCGGH